MKFRFFWLFFLAVLLAACSGNKQPLSPPFSLPLAMHKAGASAETVFTVADHREYSLSLSFFYREGNGEDRARVKQVVGDNTSSANSRNGIDTPLKVQIFSVVDAGETLIYEKEKNSLKLRSWTGNSFEKHIDYVELIPGKYRITALNQRDQTELSNIPVALTVAFYAKATPIK